MALQVGTMTDGRFEVFVYDKNGEVFHTWQAKGGGWEGAKANVRPCQWHSLGKPSA